MTNSTDFSVRRMIATSLTMRSRGTTTCTPFDARTRNRPRWRDSAWISSVHTPVALMTTCPRTSVTAPSSESRMRTPMTRSPSRSSDTTWVEDRTTAP